MRGHIKRIAEHLKKHRFITAGDAMVLYGCSRLASVIHRLRTTHQMLITCETVKSVNRYEEPVTFGRYRLTRKVCK